MITKYNVILIFQTLGSSDFCQTLCNILEAQNVIINDGYNIHILNLYRLSLNKYTINIYMYKYFTVLISFLKVGYCRTLGYSVPILLQMLIF